MKQELTTLLSSVQLLKEDNPGRKIAEIQGKLATVPLRPGKLPVPSHLPELSEGGDSWWPVSAHDWDCV
jgi:uncharacterized protein YecA (UPF0149 family)